MHRLLGSRFPESSTRFRHRRDNPLPYDVVVVDEMSMVSHVDQGSQAAEPELTRRMRNGALRAIDVMGQACHDEPVRERRA